MNSSASVYIGKRVEERSTEERMRKELRVKSRLEIRRYPALRKLLLQRSASKRPLRNQGDKVNS